MTKKTKMKTITPAPESQNVLIAMPAWNEEQSIGKVLEEIKDLYPYFDVLVINDGSEDSTAQIAKEKGVEVIDHNGNRGYTAVIQTGREYTLSNGYDFLIFVDADGQHRISDIGRILDPLIREDADQVRGSRELGKYEWKEEPLHLKIPRWICSTFVSLWMRKIVTDATSGFKGENRKVTEYFKKVYETSNRIHASNTNDVEEHLIAHKKRFKLMEVPTVMYQRESGKTKCYTAKQLLIFPSDLIRTALRSLK